MRVQVQQESIPPGMAGAWHLDAHAASLAALPGPIELVSAAFGLRLTTLVPGQTLRTSAGRFRVESVDDGVRCAQVVLLTDAPGLTARLGMTAAESAAGECSVVLYTSVHPRSWIGRAYFSLIQPVHHILMERVLLRRLRSKARRAT